PVPGLGSSPELPGARRREGPGLKSRLVGSRAKPSVYSLVTVPKGLLQPGFCLGNRVFRVKNPVSQAETGLKTWLPEQSLSLYSTTSRGTRQPGIYRGALFHVHLWKLRISVRANRVVATVRSVLGMIAGPGAGQLALLL